VVTARASYHFIAQGSSETRPAARHAPDGDESHTNYAPLWHTSSQTASPSRNHKTEVASLSLQLGI